MAWYRCRHTGSGGGVTPIGDAVQGDVLFGKTFTNATDVGLTGTMTNNGAVNITLDTSTTSYTVPEGYHNGSGTVNISTETPTITAGTSVSTTSATSGKVISSVTVNPTPSQSKSATPSTSAQTISPDSGYLLSSVTVGAISPQRNLGTAATGSGIDSTGPYVYIPYGWWKEYSGKAGSSYAYMTAAQAVAACPKQEKTSTPTTRSATAATVTPDSGKLLSKVTVNTNSVPNSNSGTKTISSSDKNWYTGNVDMGATNTYRYVNAVNVYNKGKTDGSGSVKVAYAAGKEGATTTMTAKVNDLFYAFSWQGTITATGATKVADVSNGSSVMSIWKATSTSVKFSYGSEHTGKAFRFYPTT